MHKLPGLDTLLYNHRSLSTRLILCHSSESSIEGIIRSEIYPGKRQEIHLSASLNTQLKFSLTLSTVLEVSLGEDYLMNAITRQNFKTHTRNVNFCYERQTKRVSVKNVIENIQNTQLYKSSHFRNRQSTSFLGEATQQKLYLLESFLKEVYLSSITLLPETKKKASFLRYLLKFRNFIDERTEKMLPFEQFQTQNNTKSELTSFSVNQVKSILKDQMFLKIIPERIQKIFEETCNDISYKILRKIRVKELSICKDWKPQLNSFGIIQKLSGKFDISNGSIHTDTNQIMKKDQLFINCDSQLILKMPHTNEESEESFETQLSVLLFLKEKQCQYVSEYFLEQNESEKDFKKLYSFFYPGLSQSMINQNQKCHKKLKFISCVAISLGFLVKNEIIHRDIKPSNIVLDRKNNPKLIDFGSATLCNSKPIKIKINGTLRTTYKYNYTYDNLPDEIKPFIEQHIFERSKTFDMFAFGKIMQQTINIGMRSQIGDYFYELWQWAISKCLQLHPQRRMHPKQAVLFFRMLYKTYGEMTNGEVKNIQN